jgi:CRP/FNR family transcriptional regulator, dissimilatory nitrate respiration regulator
MDGSHAAHELASTKLFADLDQSALQRLAAIARRSEFDVGETIFGQGDPAAAFCLLVRGEVKVYKLLRDGRTATLRYVRPGDTFAESALWTDTYRAYTEATAPSVVYRLPVSALRSLLLDTPELALDLLARMAHLMVLLNRRVEELLLPVPARLARYLLELCEQQLDPPARSAGFFVPAAGSGPRICRLPMTKRDLAARLGTVPETLSRALGGLKRARVIRLSGNGELVEVLDFDALAGIAQF